MQKITTTLKKTIAYLAKNLPVWKRTPHVLASVINPKNHRL